MKRLDNTKVNRISQCEKEIALITEGLMDKNNFVKNKYGFHVTNLNIAQVKQKYGIIERVNYNVGEGKSRVPNTPQEKFEAIEDALRFYKMI